MNWRKTVQLSLMHGGGHKDGCTNDEHAVRSKGNRQNSPSWVNELAVIANYFSAALQTLLRMPFVERLPKLIR